MFASKRIMGVSFGYIVVIALSVAMAAGCVPITDPAALVGPSPLSQPTVTADEEAATEIAADQSSAAESMADAVAPSPITHGLARHEACLDCHKAETGREPAPADHRDLAETVCLFCHLPEEGETAVPPLPTEAETDFCLGCHGPFEELAARTAGATLVEGIEGNPHVYVPHVSTKIFSCDNCHSVHPLPVNSADEFPQANLQYCFLACHHTEDFRPCNKCHEE